MARKIFTFAGQGSQYPGMGRELYEKDSTFRFWMDQASKIVSDLTGSSLTEKLYADKHKANHNLEDLEFSHPALFAVQYAMAKAVEERISPDLLIGASLGEFVALSFAGTFPFEDALQHIVEQAKLFKQILEKGTMVAVLTEITQIDNILKKFEIDYDHAVDCGPTNHTIASDNKNGDRLIAALNVTGVICQRLPVSFPFHSKWLNRAEYPFRWLASKLQFSQRVNIPIASCASAALMGQVKNDHLWDILREKVCLKDTLLNCLDIDHDVIIDISPTSSYVGCLKSIFGKDSTICHKAYKTLSPYRNSDNNLKQIESIKSL